MRRVNRRTFILGGLAIAGTAIVPSSQITTGAVPGRSGTYPFRLGLASGEPEPDSVVLWTRLAPSPLNADGQGGMPRADIIVDWQVSTSGRFTSLVASGSTTARFADAHSVHVVAGGLAPDSEYYYRFRTNGHISPVGRTRTAPEFDVVARNLVILAKRHPDAHFFGLDASMEMLEMADAKIDSARIRNITLAKELADNFYYVNTFEMTDRFDKIFFSYSITMIPSWREAIDNALNNLKIGGELFIVDFYDQKDLPRTFRKMLQNWLKAFHVQFWNDLLPYLGTLETKGLVRLKVTPIFKRYAFIARLEKV